MSDIAINLQLEFFHMATSPYSRNTADLLAIIDYCIHHYQWQIEKKKKKSFIHTIVNIGQDLFKLF